MTPEQIGKLKSLVYGVGEMPAYRAAGVIAAEKERCILDRLQQLEAENCLLANALVSLSERVQWKFPTSEQRLDEMYGPTDASAGRGFPNQGPST